MELLIKSQKKKIRVKFGCVKEGEFFLYQNEVYFCSQGNRCLNLLSNSWIEFDPKEDIIERLDVYHDAKKED